MASCNDCLHVKICQKTRIMDPTHNYAIECNDFKDRSRFVELSHAEWIVEEDMYGEPVYCCSNCNERFALAEGTPTDNCYFYCPNCGAEMAEQALKEREENAR